ncbi:MAG: large repetitive protein [Thermoanaerobaculia bacterium]|nr:large repetitive protein [Thermoanaerobaculia bacterium]
MSKSLLRAVVIAAALIAVLPVAAFAANVDISVSSVSGTPSYSTLNTGTNVTYFASIFNGSASSGTSPNLTLNLPASSSFVSASVTGTSGNCTGTSTVTCTWPSIPSGNTFTATIVVTPTAAGTLTLSASVTANEPDPTPANNSGSASVTVNDQIDLRVSSVSGTPSASTLNTGTNVTYFASIFNAATSQGTNPILTLVLPASSTLVSASVTGTGGNCTGTSTVTCTWPSIPSGNTFTATIVVTPTAAGTLTLSAIVTGDQTDPTPANNSGSASVTVNDQIDLNLSSLSGTPDPITFGAGNVTFTATVFNGSTSQGTNTVLAATLPSNSNYVSSSATGGGSCSQAAGTVTCNWTSIPASNTFSVSIVVAPTIAGGLTLSASVSGTQSDPNTSNNTKSKTTTVNATSCTSVPSGAVAWYRASSNAVDAVGPNTGTALGGTAYTTGKVGQAFSLNGTTAYVSIPDNSTLRPTDLTIEGWVYFTSIPSTGVIVSKTAGSAASDSYLLWYQGGALHGVVGNTSGPGTIVDYTWTPTLNTWYHVAFTSDATGLSETLYVNGAVVGAATNTTAIGYDANPLLIGAEIENSITQYFFPGRIDEVTLYNRALSQSEIQAVAGADTFGKCYISPAAPGISSFTPGTGVSGTSVVITGTNFIGVSAVTFNGTSASFVVDSTTQITATVPVAATTGTITVTAGGGSATSAGTFTVLPSNHWVNSSGGNWSVGSNWSNGVPTSSTNAIIDATGTYTVTLDTAATVASLTVGGGTSGTQTLSIPSPTLSLSGASTIAINGALNLNGGVLTGAGDLTVNGSMVFSSGTLTGAGNLIIPVAGTMWISGSGSNKFLDSRTINNSGTINYDSTGSVFVQGTTVINNLSGGNFNLKSDGSFAYNGGSPQFNNSGTLTRNTATGAITFGLAFANSNTVNVQNGTLSFDRGGSATGGTFSVSSGATLRFGGLSFAIDAGSSIAGAGSVETSGGAVTHSGSYNISGGTTASNGSLALTGTVSSLGPVIVSGGTLDLSSPSALATTSLILSGGQLMGSSTLTVNGSTMYSAGTLAGSGALVIPATRTMSITGGGFKIVDSRTINNSGAITFDATANTYAQGPTVINNLSGATWDIRSDGNFAFNGGSPQFNNSGTINRNTTTGTSIFGLALVNNNTVNVQTGLLSLDRGGSATGGTFSVASGATLRFGSQSFAFDAATSISGSGAVETSDATVTHPGSYNISGGTTSSNGSFTLTGTVSSLGPITVSGGLLTLSSASALSTTSLNITSGTLAGSSTLTVNGSTTFSGGLIMGSGTLVIPATRTMSITGGGFKIVDSRTINNSGSIIFDSIGSTYAQGTAVINNLGGATYDIRSDGGFYYNGGSPQFNNSGTINRNTTTGTSLFGLALANSGAVNVQTGLLSFDRGGSATSGTFSVASGATLRFGGSLSFALDSSSSISGAGSVETAGAAVTHPGSYNISGGTTASNGSLALTGPVSSLGPVIVSGGILDLSSASALATTSLVLSGGQLMGSSTLTVNGSTTYSAGTLTGPGTLVIPATRTMSITGGGFKILDSRTINNSGTITFLATANTYAQGTAVINNLSGGIYDIQSDFPFAYNGGSPQFNNSGTINRNTTTGTSLFGLALANSGTVNVQAGLLSFDRGGSASGGTFSVASGSTLRFGGSLSFALDSSSSISGAGTVETAGAAVTHSGTYNIGGGTTASNGSLALTGPVSSLGPVIVSGGTLDLSSASALSTTSLALSGGQLMGSSTLTVNGPTSYSGGTLTGSGALVIPATRTMSITGGGFKFLDSRTINNSGTITFLATASTYAQGTAVINNLSGGVYDIQSDSSFAFNGGSPQFNNSGTVEKTAGTGTSTVGLAMNNQAGGTILAQIGTINLASLTQSGTLSFPITGSTGYGTINVGSPFALGGTLTATTTGGYTPLSGATFPVLTYASLPTGAFTTKNLTYSGGHFTDATSSSAVTLTAVSSCDPVPSGAISWYRAEGNAVDSVGINNGYLSGGTTTTAGNVGQAFNFDGINDSVNVPMSGSLQLTTGATVEFWMKGDPSNNLTTCCQGLVATDMYAIEVAGSGVHFGLSTDNGATTPFPSSGQVAISTNQWHHIAGTYDGSTITLYVDGVPAASAAHTGLISANSGFLSIGSEDGRTGACPACVGTRYFKGLIDEVAIYNRALTAAEVADIYNAGSTGKCFSAAAPTITGFTPSSGASGTSVAISGTNLIGTSSVTFNGTPAVYTVNSSTQITATVPASATTGTIAVTTAGGTAASAGAFTVVSGTHWTNASGGNWNVASNWSGGSVPTASDNAFIDAAGTYTVTLNVNPSFNSLTVGGGATGTQTLDLGSGHTTSFPNASVVTTSGVLTFSNGTLSGAAGLTINGTMNWSGDSTINTPITVASGATLNMTGAGTRSVDGVSLSNSGTVNWNAGNNISIYNSGSINNLSGGLFSITGDQLIYQSCCAAALQFSNAGTVRKTVATGQTSFSGVPFNNTGTVDIQSGTFSPRAGTSTGVFNATASGTWLFDSGSYTIGTGGTLTGAGAYTINGAQLNVSASAVVVDHLTITSGVLNLPSGGAISTSASGIVDWNGASTITGAGTLAITSGGTINLSGAGTRIVDGITLNNGGTANWSGGNNLSIINSGVINNLSGALFYVTNDNLIYYHCCAPGQAFNNAGTFRKSTATGTTSFSGIGFNNSGTVDIQSGTISPVSGTSTGIFNAASSGTFLFGGGSYTLASGATLTGSGNFLVNGAQLNITGAGITVAHLTLSTGALSIGSGVTLSTTTTGVIDWNGASTLGGPGSLDITGSATINLSGAGTRIVDGATLNNSGTANWSGGNNLSLINSGVINNQSGGLFTVTNDQLVYYHCCAPGLAVNNAGTFRKSTATGTTTFSGIAFNNTGTVDIQSGTITGRTGTSSSVFNVASAGTFLFDSGTYTLSSGATLTGSGKYQVDGGTLAVDAAGVTVDHLILRSGALSIGGSLATTAAGVIDWDGASSLAGSGSLTITNGGTLNLSGAGTRIVDTATINNSGTANWSAGNNISIINSGLINNMAGALFNVTGDQLVYYHCCAPGQAFNNAGTFRKSASTGITTFNGIGFSNSGTIQPRSGTLQINSYSSSGSPTYDFGIDNDTTYGRLSFANAFAVSGTLVAAPINGYVPSGGRQFQIFSSPSISGTFSSKTLTFGSSPVRSFADSYTATSVVLTTSGPTITTPLSPAGGSISGGDFVTITGTGFVSGGSLGVTFGGAAATSVTVVNSTTITCTTPAHAPGVVDVVLTNGDGQPTTAFSAFAYDNPPNVTTIRPTSGSTAGSGDVIIEGTNLNTVTSVSFGGINGTILSSSAGQLTVAAPPHSAGAVNVVLTNNVGNTTLTNGFTYVANDDAARDFFLTTNPSARWSYGYETSRGSAFNLYSTHSTNTGFDSWTTAGYPLLGRNSTSGTLQQSTNFTPSMKLLLHPSNAGENSVIRWTATAAGSYRIHGYFVGLDQGVGTTSDVAILHNNSSAVPLFSTNINSYNVPQNFDVTLSLGSGDTIEFTVGFGSNGSYNGDSTGLDVTIDPAGAASADLNISSSASASTVASGAAFFYSTTVTNYGVGPATNVVATIALPANVTLNGSPTSTQGSCTGTTTITCTIGNLSVNGTATQTINVLAGATGTATANASVTGTETDPSNTNNASAISVTITGGSTLTVTTNADSGSGSLRQAVLDANNGSICPSPCTIAFNLPSGQRTIAPLTSIPSVDAANVTIDATTQPGFAGTPLVTLDGTSDTFLNRGLQLNGGNDTVKGLSIVNFQGSGILIHTAGSDTISGNYIGIRTDGVTQGQNAGDGVTVLTANNTIGGFTAAARNVISGNFGSGVVLTGSSATGNFVSGNYIGLNAAGNAAVANQTDGVQILFGASNNTIGGAITATRNVISGNSNSGVYIAGGSSNNIVTGKPSGVMSALITSGSVCNSNVVAANLIGTDATGTAALPNTTGVYVGGDVTNSTIGGQSTSTANTIASITKGISLDGPGNGNVILRNAITGNSGMSIDLANDGPTANDAGDSDVGANGLQNTPVFVDATLAGSTLTAHVNVDSSAVSATNGIRVELFKSDNAGTHALLWLGSQCYSGNVLSAAAMTIPSAPVAVGDKLVATATSYIDGSCSTAGDGTSELSATPATVAACTPPTATITPGGPTTFCSGGSVNLTASVGASYQWRNFGTPLIGANAQVFNATTSGSYSVTVTNASGCSATSANVSVTANTTVSVTISAGGPTTFCSGGNVTLNANPSGGSGTFASYQWLLNGSAIPSANSASYSATTTGSYTVTATDSAGCTGTSAPQSVTVSPSPSAAISAPASVCPNSTAGASITNPVGGATYTWSITNGTLQTGQGTPSITFAVTNASPVSISVTASASGCTSTGSASVNVGVFTPTITPSGPQSFCPGGSVTLTASAASSYQWLLNGSPIPSANLQTYAATAAGSYSVSASNAGGCSGTSATVTVTQSAAPSPVVSAGGPTTFCQGGSVTLSTGAASSYQWMLNGSPIGGANGSSTPATVSGSYSVTVTNGGGCSATSSPISVTVNPSPVVTITGPSSICGASSVTLDAGAGFASYNWSTGASTQTITVAPSATTTYNVTVTSAAGCSGSASKTVTVSSGSSSTTVLAPSSVIANSTGNSASVSAAQNGSTYSWSITGGTITNGDGTPSILWTAGPSGSATISVVVTSGSCTASGSATVAITNAADVSLTASAAPNPVNPGGTLTFTLNVANSGPNTALNVRVTNNLYGVTAPAAAGAGWSCTTSALTIVCTAASISAGSSAPLTITATASGNSNAGDDAYVLADTTDPNGGNNTANAQTAIQTQQTCTNSAATLVSPAAGASNVPNPVTFTWSSSANALSYDLWIASSGAAPAIAATTSSTSAMLSLPSGPSTWYVAAHFGNNCPTLFSTPRDFTVAAATNCVHDAPQLIAPSPNAVINSPVTFNWTPAAQAVGYRLWVAIDGGAAQDVGTTNGATSLTVPLSGSSVTWHVDAIFPGCNPTSSALSTFSLAVADVCGNHPAPSLLAPASGATLTSSIVDLQWSAVSNANGYRVWAGINGAELAPIGTTAAATTLHTTFSSGTVAWFVEALFNGCASSPSPQRTFTITPAASCDNPAPSPLAPANDATIGNSEVDFSWSSVPNAIGYELWLALNNGTPSPAGTTTTTTLRRTVGAGVVDWFVRAQFNGCAPSDSEHAHFTFAPPADCALVRPILTAPADGAAKVFSPLNLRWSNVPGATQYKVWLASGDAVPVVIGTTSASHLDNQTVPSGSVSWFVEALFDHCPALQSTHSAFTAVPPPPPCGTPDIPLPRADSTASTNVEYQIRWTAGGPAATTQYELQESTDPGFTAPVSLTIDASEWPFKHINTGDAPVKYYYRVRSVGTCNGARSLFSLPLTVNVLPSNVSDPNSANGSTPADNPQTTHYEIHLGGTSNGVVHKGSIAAAAGDTFTATTNQPWLTVSPSSGTVAAGGTTLNVTAKTDGLPVGTSSGAVNITFGSASGNANGNRVALDTKPASTTTISVNLVQPVSPNAKSGPPPDALIIPAVAHADGVNSKFQSDIRVTNSSAQPMKYQVTFVPTGDTGITQGKQTTVDIDPGRTIALDDVLQSWFGDSSATGTLEVRPLTTTQTSSTTALPAGLANILTFASSRTYNTTANGTFGQYIPAIPFAAFVGRGSDPSKSTILSLQQIAQSSAYRTNLGIVEGSGDPASVLVSVFGSNGQKLTEFTQDLKGGQHIQLNSILAQKNVQVTDGRIEVKVVSPVGKVTAYASVLDNATNDPLLVSPVAVNQTAAARYVIPGVADLNNGIANWQTDVRVFNPSTNIVKATLTFYSQNGGTPQTKDIQLAPGQVQTLDATLRNTFGITNDGGALHIATTATTPLVATARTYNQTPNGTYGQFIPAVTANDAAALGTRPLQILQIEETDRYRTNVGFAEVTGKSATIEVTAVPSDSKVAASTQISLSPNQFIQYPQLLRSMGLSNMYNARISVKVISGQGRVTAYASVIDMQTNDPTFVPAQ